MWNAVIDVNVEPTRLDELMWQIAVFSTLATVFLGGLAWWNGHRATVIAEDVAKRDQAHRDAERARIEYDSRHPAAHAMTRSFWALEIAIRFEQKSPGAPESKAAIESANNTKLEAITEIELLHPDEDPVLLIWWFEQSWSRIKSLKEDHLRNPYRGEAIGSVRRWKSRVATVYDFLSPLRELPLP